MAIENDDFSTLIEKALKLEPGQIYVIECEKKLSCAEQDNLRHAFNKVNEALKSQVDHGTWNDSMNIHFLILDDGKKIVKEKINSTQCV